MTLKKAIRLQLENNDVVVREFERVVENIDRRSSKAAQSASRSWEDSTRRTERAFRGQANMIGQQISDIVVQLEAGANAFRVFLQQGSQIAYLLGGQIGLWFAIGSAMTLVVQGLMRIGEVSTEVQKEFQKLTDQAKSSIAEFFDTARSADELRQALTNLNKPARETVIQEYAGQVQVLNEKISQFRQLLSKSAQGLTLSPVDRRALQLAIESPSLGEIPGRPPEPVRKEAARRALEIAREMDRLRAEFDAGKISAFELRDAMADLDRQLEETFSTFYGGDKPQRTQLREEFRAMTEQVIALEEALAKANDQMARLRAAQGEQVEFPGKTILPADQLKNIQSLEKLIQRLEADRDELYRRVVEFDQPEQNKKRAEIARALQDLPGVGEDRAAYAERLAAAVDILDKRLKELQVEKDLREQEQRRLEIEQRRIDALEKSLELENTALSRQLRAMEPGKAPEDWQIKLSKFEENLLQRRLSLGLDPNDPRLATVNQLIDNLVTLYREKLWREEREDQRRKEEAETRRNESAFQANLANIQRQTLALRARESKLSSGDEPDSLETRIEQFMLELEAAGVKLNEDMTKQLNEALAKFREAWQSFERAARERDALKVYESRVKELTGSIVRARTEVSQLEIELRALEQTGVLGQEQAQAFSPLLQFQDLKGTQEYETLEYLLGRILELRRKLTAQQLAREERDKDLEAQAQAAEEAIRLYAKLGQELEQNARIADEGDRAFGDLETKASALREQIIKITERAPELRELLLQRSSDTLFSEYAARRAQEARKRLEELGEAAAQLPAIAERFNTLFGNAVRSISILQAQIAGVSTETLDWEQTLADIDQELKSFEGVFTVSQIEELRKRRIEQARLNLYLREQAKDRAKIEEDEERSIELWTELRELQSDSVTELETMYRVFGDVEARAKQLVEQIGKLRIPTERKQGLLNLAYEALSSAEIAKRAKDDAERLKDLQKAADSVDTSRFEEELKKANRELDIARQRLDGFGNEATEAVIAFRTLEYELADFKALGFTDEQIAKLRAVRQEIIRVTEETRFRQEIEAAAAEERRKKEDAMTAASEKWMEQQREIARLRYQLNNIGRKDLEYQLEVMRILDEYEANPYKEEWRVKQLRDQLLTIAKLKQQIREAEEAARNIPDIKPPRSREEVLDERAERLEEQRIRLEQEISLLRFRADNLHAQNLEELVTLEQYRLELLQQYLPGLEEQIQLLMKLKELQMEEQKQLDEREKKLEDVQRLGEQAGYTLTSGLWDAVTAGRSLNETIIDITRSLVDMLAQYLLIEPFASALGAGVRSYFSPKTPAASSTTTPTTSSPVPHAKGAVYAKPSYFNLGLMAEAGPEAIMPLSRNARGELGVKASTAQPVQVNIIDQRGPDAPQVKVQERREGSRVLLEAVITDTVNGLIERGALDRSMRGRYGLSRRPR
jgi:hypothetical protein